MTLRRFAGAVAFLLVTVSGCAHKCGSAGCGTSAYRPCDAAVRYPPPAVRLQPQPVYAVSPGPAPVYPQYVPRPDPNSAPYPATPYPATPYAAPPSAGQPSGQPGVQLAPPSSQPYAGSSQKLNPLPSQEPASGQASLPAIPQFAEVKNGKLSSGLRPHPIDGLSWLQARGYRAVLCLRAPGEEDSADRRLAEKHGMRYLTLEVSMATLTRETADQFNQIVSDPENQPLFVYDRDGVLAGALWYLHFRMVEHYSPEVARSQAARLGLKSDQSPEAIAAWAAVEKIAPAS